MQATDFATTDGGFTAIDPPVFFSLPPLMTGVGLLLLLLALLIGWWLGRESGRANAPTPGVAAKEIYDAVLKASTAAVSAPNDDLKSKTIALQKVLKDLLGPVLELGKGLSGATRGIDDALKGKIKVETSADHGHTPHPPTHAPAHGESGHDGHAQPAPAAAVSSVTVIGLPIGSMVTPPAQPGHGPGHGGPKKDEMRDMTADEQVDALARAVRVFHNYWVKDGRKAELIAARDALGKRPPLHLLPGDKRFGGGSDDSRGWRFGD